jgi:hypothetical protein
VVTRRTLLAAAGGAVVLAGCGKDAEEAEAPPPAATAMLGELAAERALAHELTAARGLEGEVRDRSAARARRLAAAIADAGGDPHEAGEPDTPPDPARAASRARAALERHVTALPSLTGSLRAMGADLVVGAAADAAVLGSPPEAFPGTPS